MRAHKVVTVLVLSVIMALSLIWVVKMWDSAPDGDGGDNEFIGTLMVSGQKIIDADGNVVNLSGFSLWSSDVFYRTGRIEQDLKNIKSWGFNTVQVVFHWTRYIETQVGVYDENNVGKVEQIVQWAEREGLYVILTMRTSSEEWTNQPSVWGGWNYPDMFDPEYRRKAIAKNDPAGFPVPEYTWDYYVDRFLNCWRYMIRSFDGYDNVVGYNLDFFPWHGKDPFTGYWMPPTHKFIHYENTMVPMYLQMLREESGKIYFFTPVRQGNFYVPEIGDIVDEAYPKGELPNEKVSASGGYNPDFNRNDPSYDVGVGSPLNPSDMGLLSDGNVVYCFGGHYPLNAENSDREPKTWTSTSLQMEYLYWQFYPMKRFIDRYNVPSMITEFGLFYFNAPRPVAKWRLDFLDDRMKELNGYGINWVYWIYHCSNAESVVDESNNLNEIGEVLVANIP